MTRKILFVAAGFMALAPTALAGSGNSGYGGNAGGAQVSVQKSGTLPFTGLSLTAFAIVGVLLIATGVFLHRRTTRTED